MNEGPQQTPEAEQNGPLGGERLAAARRAHEISATDIAKELHLDELKIRALERNEFGVLGAPVFAKGHLRKYAELVGVPVDDVLADYYELNRSAGAPPVVGPKRKFRRNIAWGPWVGATIVVIIVAGAAYWFFTRGPALSLSRSTPAVQVSKVPAATETEPREESADTASAEAEPEPVPAVDGPLPETVVASPVQEVGEAAPIDEAPNPLPRVNVELVYSGDCWTEVTDASGRSLFYDLGTEGRVVTLAGDEPLEVVLGASENVSIAVEGRDFPIPDSARRGRMARLTIQSR